MDLSTLLQGGQGTQILIAALATLLALCLALLLLIVRLFRIVGRFRQLMKGASGENLETIVQEALLSSRQAQQRLEELQEQYEKLRQTTAASIQHVGLVRFNAFPEMGSDLSFALALLNRKKDGVVLCCLVGRDDCRIYAKNLVGGKSSYLLSDEEKEAIHKALCNDISLK
ncbi:MAG: DUF4446 family protein [Thermacetogeniaceae bacterium]|jgi:uncharacterized membrane protein|nr:DUF4446 family protein [Syntrophomonadaceae bacterium]